MICETCHGQRFIDGIEVIDGVLYAVSILTLCPECGGHGFTHCCDGEQAQPDCPCCDDGCPVIEIDGRKMHDALGFMWPCDRWRE